MAWTATSITQGRRHRAVGSLASFHRQAALATEDDDEFSHQLELRWAISDEIREIQPLTDAGLRAKAGIAVVLLEENALPKPAQRPGFAYDLMRDILAMGARA